MEGLELAKEISELILSKKGYDIKILDIRGISSVADFFVICSADSDIQVKAITDEIERKLRKRGIKPYNREGTTTNTWVLLDYVDVVVHVFKHETRLHYSLEKLWGDANFIEIKDEPKEKAEEEEE
jgi:ribosome-associated protein